jgi:MoxR-like ATPase
MSPDGTAPAAAGLPGSPDLTGREPVTAREAEEHAAAFRRLRESVARRIVGQDEVVREVLMAILAEGHCLIIGVPGLAKTLIVSTIADALSLLFRRIQFTPDLMPSDITGATIISQEPAGDRGYQFLRGPVFANVLLADEINRTPPKTQAALMEAMEERQVTAGGARLPLERPFFVLATQNPIEQEGTYPLPVSQTDRFMFNVLIDYPSEEEEFEILELTTSAYRAHLDPVLDREEILLAIAAARRVAISESLVNYAARVVRRTRPADPSAPPFVREWLSWGAGPRAVQAIILGAKAGAILSGRPAVEPEDIHGVILPTLRHRVLLSYHAEAEGVIPDAVIERILEGMPDGLYRKAMPKVRKAGLIGRLFGRK